MGCHGAAQSFGGLVGSFQGVRVDLMISILDQNWGGFERVAGQPRDQPAKNVRRC